MNPVAACELCGSRETLMRCSRCRQVWYCGKEHQKSHWKKHKLICVQRTTVTSLTPEGDALSNATSARPTLSERFTISRTQPHRTLERPGYVLGWLKCIGMAKFTNASKGKSLFLAARSFPVYVPFVAIFI